MVAIFIVIKTSGNTEVIRSSEGVFSVEFSVMVNSIFKSDFLFGSSSVVTSLLQVSVDVFSSVFVDFNFSRVDDMRDTSSGIIITTTRITRLFNRYIFVLVDWNIIDNWFRYSNWNFFLNGVRYNGSFDTFRLRVLSSFVDWFKSGFLSWGLVELNLNFFSVDGWLNYLLGVVNITRNIDILNSVSLLVDGFFGNWSVVDYLVLFLFPSDVDVFSLLDWLDVRLGDILVSSDVISSSVDIVLNFSFSFNWTQSFFYSFSGQNLNVGFDFFDGGLDDITVVDNITRYVDSLGSLLSFVLSFHSDWSVGNILIFSLGILGSNLFDGFINRRLDDNSLSGGLNDLVGDNSGLTSYSFSNNLWLGSNSLGNDFGLSGYSFLHNLCVLE